ncbi:MAG: hypothetical protein IJ288_02400 [Alistipes sp.]|nr:hypothetical protein [Alistipes sp.]
MIKPTTNKKALCFSVMPQKLQRPQGLPSAANDIPVILQNTNATVLYATNLQPSERKRPKSPPEEGI